MVFFPKLIDFFLAIGNLGLRSRFFLSIGRPGFSSGFLFVLNLFHKSINTGIKLRNITKSKVKTIDLKSKI
jgi:hypothetical protein